MKNLRKVMLVASVFALFALFLLACDVENQQTAIQPETSAIFQGVELYTDLGQKHNDELNSWFNLNKNNLRGKDVDSRLRLVDTYFLDKYSINTSDIKYRIFNATGINPNSKLAEQEIDFDPFLYLEANKSEIQPETYKFLTEFFTRTGELDNLENELAYLEQLENDVISSTSISIYDKNGIRNLIIVYKASAEYWSANLDQWLAAYKDSPNGRITGIADEDYQKIVWADVVEGIAGGLLAGPLGALVGLTAGSITMAIGVYE